MTTKATHNAGAKREAAGFFLYRLGSDGKPEFLLLRNSKRGDWGVPKGHADAGDADILATAVRELEEETGLKDVLIHSGFRTTIEYTARRASGGPEYLKRVTYFLARLERGKVKLSKEHDQLAWAIAGDTRKALAFPNLVRAFNKAVILAMR